MILTPLAQGLLLLTASPQFDHGPPEKSLALFALVAPVLCYFWGLRSLLQLRGSWPRIVRIVLLVLVSAALSFLGFFCGLMMVTSDLNSR